MLKLRPYQAEAVSAVLKSLFANENNNPLLVLPTGTGKSIIIAEIIRVLTEHSKSYKCMMLTHVSELVTQNFEKLKLIGVRNPGIYSANLNRKDIENNIIFGTVQSVYSALKANKKIFGSVDLILIDEAHLVSDKNTSMYRSVISYLKVLNKKIRVIGLSATPYRLKTGLLTEQKDAIFNCIAYDLNHKFNALIQEGYLCTLKTFKPGTFFDMSDVHIKAGEFKADEVNAKFTDQELKDACINIKHIAKGNSRKHLLIFVSSIDIADKATGILNRIGFKSCAVHSKNDNTINAAAINDFKEGKVKALVNVDKLTTGFDAPFIDLIAILRPTTSASLHVQMLGRGTRPAPDKKDCMVLDFVGNIERLGSINKPITPQAKRKRSKGDAPVKSCPQCSIYVSAGVRVCSNCGYEFKEKEQEFNFHEGLAVAPDPNSYDVAEIKELSARHCYPGQTLAGVIDFSIKEYITQRYEQIILCEYETCFLKHDNDDRLSTKKQRQYLFFNRSEKWAAESNKHWWHAFAGKDSAVPQSTDEVLERQGELKNPQFIKIDPRNNEHYPNFYFLNLGQ